MKIRRIFFFGIYFLMMQASQAKTPTVQENEIVALLDQWIHHIESRDLEKILSLYCQKAIFLPTLSDDMKYGNSAIGRYFSMFFKLQPKIKVIMRHIQVLDSDTASDSGKYLIETQENGQVKQLFARYTFVYEKIDGRWLIKSHHSSKICDDDEKKMILAIRILRIFLGNQGN